MRTVRFKKIIGDPLPKKVEDLWPTRHYRFRGKIAFCRIQILVAKYRSLSFSPRGHRIIRLKMYSLQFWSQMDELQTFATKYLINLNIRYGWSRAEREYATSRPLRGGRARLTVHVMKPTVNARTTSIFCCNNSALLVVIVVGK